jgi:hypothetical protein
MAAEKDGEWRDVEMDVSNSLSQPTNRCTGLEFPRFKGEPDAGVAFRGERCPFGLVEVGVLDSGKKTKQRAAHWVTRGKPGVYTLDGGIS